MKIISPFKDYYDGLMSHDASTGIYKRTSKEIPVDWFGYCSSATGFENGYRCNTGIIGFCGKIYPYVQYEYTIKGKTTSGFAYSYDRHISVLKEMQDIKISRHSWYENTDLFNNWTRADNGKRWFDCDFNSLQEKVHAWGGNGKMRNYPNLTDIFIEQKVPCFAIVHNNIKGEAGTGYAIITNPRLADYKFFTMFDAYTTFSMIEQFINNEIIKPDDPYIEPISDGIRLEGRGFNAESFRKPKGEKKRKNKRKLL